MLIIKSTCVTKVRLKSVDTCVLQYVSCTCEAPLKDNLYFSRDLKQLFFINLSFDFELSESILIKVKIFS